MLKQLAGGPVHHHRSKKHTQEAEGTRGCQSPERIQRSSDQWIEEGRTRKVRSIRFLNDWPTCGLIEIGAACIEIQGFVLKSCVMQAQRANALEYQDCHQGQNCDTTCGKYQASCA